jgi:hypothetical protein
MAGSDDFQRNLNKSAQPVGGDFTYESEGGSGSNGSVDQDMRIQSNKPDTSYDRQVTRESERGGGQGSYVDYGQDDSSGSENFAAGVANKYIRNASRTNPVNIEALDKSIRSRPLYHEAKGKLEDLNTFGDMYRYGREELPEWKQPDPMEGIEKPDFDGIYDRTKEDLNDMKL